MPSLLIVDDEPNVLYSFRKRLESETLTVATAETGAEAIGCVQSSRPDAVLLDIRLPDMSGLDAFDQIRRLNPRLPVIIVTAYSTTDTAIDAMQRGAYEYLIKPVDIHQLREVVRKAVDLSRMRSVPAVIDGRGPNERADRIVGSSPAMQRVYKDIGRVASQDVPVVILGESGTGKELVARALFHYSHRAERPFLAINCAALPESLLESELFGHERGAFTGADRQRIGKFEQADGGTIFLDELGDMSAATQAKLLRLLQDGRFERVGGNETLQVDVRIIAATNRNLETQIAAGTFREDLLYRLNGYTIQLPPLRERKDDIPQLVEQFLRVAAAEMGAGEYSISPDALQILVDHRWPGNVRELQSAVRYALVQALGSIITPECLPESCRSPGAETATDADRAELAGLAQMVRRMLERGETDLYRRVLAETDRIVIGEVLRSVRGNQVQASERLGVSRTTLRSKLSHLGLNGEGS